MNPAKFRWGVLFILAGSLLLLNNIGRMEWWVWEDIISLWPLLLIAIGIEKIFQNTKISILSYLSTLALAAVVLWAAVGGIGFESNLISFGGQTRYQVDNDGDVKRLVADFNMDDEDIYLKGTGRHLFSSSYEGYGRSPKIEYDTKDDVAHFKVNERDNWRIFSLHSRDIEGFDVALSKKLPLKIDCSGDEADMKLDFRTLNLEELTVDSDDGRVRIFIGDQVDNVKLSLDGNDPDYRLQFPKDAGLRVWSDSDKIERYLERLGLVKSESYFVTEGYDSLKPQIDIELSSDLSRLSIRYY